MKPPLLSHALEKEFPSLAEKLYALKSTDGHFAHILEQHDTVDKAITDVEEKKLFMKDEAFNYLKRERLLLKDTLYHILTHEVENMPKN